MKKNTKRIVTAVAVAAMSACFVMQYVALPSYPESRLPDGSSSGSSSNVSDKDGVNGSGNLNSALKTEEVLHRLPAENDLVTVIVKLKGDGMLDYANRYGVSVSEAFTQFSAASEMGKYARLQSNTQLALSSEIVKTGYRYNTIFNGFSAQIYYRDIAKIEANKNVDKVILSNTYAVPETITENYVNVHESTGIFNSEEMAKLGYNGTGTVVGVLDTGTDYTHEVFRTMPVDESKLAINKEKVAEAVKNGTLTATTLATAAELSINEDDLYINEKLPFAFDYGDSDTNVYSTESHGTHVAGIIAGKSDTITGVATEAQIATFKVFSDYGTGAETESILAGLNDAVTLGVDAINMSLGTSCGFSREEDDDAVNEVYEKIEESGICLVVAASNDYSSGFNSTHGVNLASNPDSGTIGSPASYDASMAVASVSGVKTKCVVANGEREIYFNDSSKIGSDKKNDFVAELLGGKDSATFDYVVIPGVGMDVNYASLGGEPGKEVQGKIAVVKRGSTSFEDKVRTAQNHGAAGVIIYNNVSGTIGMSVGTKTYIPSCSVSMDFGSYLEATGSGSFTVSKDYLAGPFMSDFSSWGVLPNLTLSPDITAHGGEILSAVVGGDDYDTLSGTSMACPNLAGALVLVRQYVKNFDKNYTTQQVRDISYSRMMSTATIVHNEEGNPYSPRKQGAGIADMMHAVNSKAYLTVDGSNKPKLSLGDDPSRSGVYTMTFNVVNSSSETLSYDLGSLVFTEAMSSDNKTVAEKAYMLNDAKKEFSVSGEGSQSGNTVTVQPNGTAKVTAKISLTAANKEYLNANFRNGMYVEGYICLDSKNTDNIDMNIPFLAFYGDWADAPMLDVSAYEIGESQVDSSVKDEDKLVADVFGTIPYVGFNSSDDYGNDEMAYLGMGAYNYVLPEGVTAPATRERYAALSTNTKSSYTIYGIYAGLLRGAKRTEMEIRDSSTGELIWSRTSYNGRKAYSAHGGLIEVEFDASKYNLPNNGKYTFSMESFLDWKDGTYGNRNTYEFEFTIDNEVPVLTDYKVREEETSGGIKRRYIDFYYYDNHYMQAYLPVSYDGTKDEDGKLNNQVELTPYIIPVYDGEFNGTTKVSIDVTDSWDKIVANGYHLYVTAMDYVNNTLESDIVIKPEEDVKVEKTRTAKDGYTIRPNGQMDLKDYVNVTTKIGSDYLEGYWMEDLVWTSTDESIVEVRDGVITGKKSGLAVITVSPQSNPDGNKVSFNIKVEGAATTIGLTGLKLSTQSVSLERGEEIVLTASLEPYNFTGEVELEWSSTSANVSVEKDPENQFKATVRAVKSGGTSGASADIVVSAKGTFFNTKCSVSVKAEYELDGIYLRSYTGRGDENGVVEIPDDLGIVYLYRGAFMGNKYVKKIVIPEGVTTVMRAAIYGCDVLEEVVLPTTVETIEVFGLAWNTNLKKINLGKVRTIGYLGLYNSPLLEELDLSSMVYIGTGAFAVPSTSVSNLKSVDLSNVGYVGDVAFQNTGLTSVTIPAKTRVGEQAFGNCNELKTAVVESDYIGTAAFAQCGALQSVTFINDVRKIGNVAFAYCGNLTSVTFAKTVYEIGAAAFAETALKTFTIPAGLEKAGSQILSGSPVTTLKIANGAKLSDLGVGVFQGISSLSAYAVDADNPDFAVEDGVLYSKDKTTLISYPYGKAGLEFTVPASVKTIGPSAFYESALTRIKFAESSVERIEEFAFGGMANDGSLRIEGYENVTYIGDGAFFGYTSNDNGTTSIHKRTLTNGYPFGNKIEYIGALAFAGNSSSTSSALVLPDSLVYLGDSAFYWCEGIESVTFGTGLNYTGESAFEQCTGLKSVSFGALTEISERMFYGCSDLGSANRGTLVIPDSVTKIGMGAFMGTTALKDVTLPNGLTEVPELLFASLDNEKGEIVYASGLTSVVIPDTVTKIGDGAFYRTQLASIDLKNVTEIGILAFMGTNLRTVESEKVVTVGDGAFASAAIGKIYLPETVEIGEAAFGDNSRLTIVNLPKLEKAGARAFASCTFLEEIYLDALTELGAEAFSGATLLSEVSFNRLQRVGAGAFYGTAITEIYLPAELSYLEEMAFYGAEKLTAVNVSANCEKYFSEDGVVYMRNEGNYVTLVSYPNGKTEKKYTAKDRTLKVGAFAFAGNSHLEEVTLPPHLQIIGAYAFAEMENLKVLNLRCVFAPRLESYSVLVEKTDLTGKKYTEYVNEYGNFKVNLGLNGDEHLGADDFDGLRIIVPDNMAQYDSYTWNRYVGAIIETSGKKEVSRDAIEFMDRVAALPAELTKEHGAELAQLAIMYNMLAAEQKAFVQNYDGVNYYELLQKAQQRYNVLFPDEQPTDDSQDGLPAWAWALIGIAIALVVAGAGAGAFLFIKRKQKSEPKQSEPEQAEKSEQERAEEQTEEKKDGETDGNTEGK